MCCWTTDRTERETKRGLIGNQESVQQSGVYAGCENRPVGRQDSWIKPRVTVVKSERVNALNPLQRNKCQPDS